MRGEKIEEAPERAIAIVGAVAGSLICAALIAGFYTAYVMNRVAFWTWLAALVILIAGDLLLSRFTGMLSISRMSSLYTGVGVPHPRSRARIAVTFARLIIPALILACLYWQVGAAVISVSRSQPAVPLAALLVAFAGGAAYVYAVTGLKR